jgi:3-oxoacyl-[acyl-carrier protein] reductase
VIAVQSLAGQTALVTGAGSGIGRGIALVLASEGAMIVAVDLNDECVALTAAAVRELGGEAIAFTADVSLPSDVVQAVDAAVARSGRLDILASNVGIFPDTSLEELEEATWDRVMAVNVKSAFLLMRAALPVMRRQQYGRIVVTGSITGFVTGVPALAHYGASKAALIGLVRGAALEAARDGVTINAVLPGNIDTEGARAAGGAAYFELMRPSIPLGRLGLPDDIGWAVRMLAAPEASFITGTTLIVDGGQSIAEGGITAERMEAVFSSAGVS